MLRAVLAGITASVLAAQTPVFSISGLVSDRHGPLPGVIVMVTGPAPRKTVTDAQGLYRVDGLPAGDYRVVVGIAGFRSRHRDIALTRHAIADFVLSPGVLVTVDWITPTPAEAYRMADAIARLRIDRRRPPEPCGPVVATTHDATVLDTIKGTLAPSMLFVQTGAGVCLDETGEKESSEPPLEAGGEYVVFLRRAGHRFESVAGPGLTFGVTKGLVRTRGYAGLPPTLTLAEFYAAVRRMERLSWPR